MNLEIFDYEDKQVRVIKKDNVVWFVAKDVCQILEIENIESFIEELDEDEWSKTIMIDPLGEAQDTYILTESGVYEAMIRRKARDLKRWIQKEVLSVLHKREETINSTHEFIDTYFSFVDDITKQLLIHLLEMIKKQNQMIGKMKPKEKYFDEFVSKCLLTNFRDTAKELKISPQKFNEYLIQRNYVYRDRTGNLRPYQNYKEQGLFELKEFFNKCSGYVGVQTMITPKGRETFKILIDKEKIV